MPKTILTTGAARGIGSPPPGSPSPAAARSSPAETPPLAAEAASEKLGPACHGLALDAPIPASSRAPPPPTLPPGSECSMSSSTTARFCLDWDASPLDLDPEVLRRRWKQT
ncbi:MAG: hypothetical protein R3F11_06700 [Verrucomicrobiales bacterium]